MKSNRLLIGVIIAVAIIALVIGGGTIWNQANRQPEKITIAAASQPVLGLIYVAEVQGYFVDEGLEVTYKSFTSGQAALRSVLEGEPDIATVFETPVMLRTYEDDTLSVVSSSDITTHNMALVARRHAGSATSLDLRGKTIAVSQNSRGEFFLFLIPSNQGIELADVTFVDTQPQELVNILIADSLDTVATWKPNLHSTQQVFGEADLVPFYSDVSINFSVLAGQRDIVTDSEETILRLLRAVVRAEKFIQNNESETIRIVIERLPDQPEPPARGFWENIEPEAKLDHVMLRIFEQEAQWFKEAGKFQMPIPNFGEVLLVDYFKSVTPEAVPLARSP